MWSFTIDPADQRSAPREQETTPLVRKHPLPVSQRKGPRFHDSCAKRPARSQKCLPSASAFRSKSAMDTCTQCGTGARCYAGEPYCVSMALRELDGCFHRGNCYQQGQSCTQSHGDGSSPAGQRDAAETPLPPSLYFRVQVTSRFSL